MNLKEQIGALEMGVDQLIQVVTASREAEATTATDQHVNGAEAAAAETVAEEAPVETAVEEAPAEPQAPAEKPTLHIERPSQNEITMTIGGKSVTLHPLQLGQLIEELSNARASMEPEVPPNLPAGWRFVSTKNPAMAVQKQTNGDRLLVMRHTGHGWVPFQFSPETVIQMYMMLTQK
ncbi:hypothetical protein [Paraburkholderia hospita]|jgi:hypothetical protein|uniref:Phage tail protein n=1 Tax=Paraburkholderia hospita TaxID=169430 RepID=A0AAN1JAT9_9BURK|nr:hypothetical protein [Paraburkholderia hospita]SOE85124.1 hypothetical protein SAMN05446935_5585 [Burkholderia sp. YR290]AUT70392.1 hypothetical protein C2L64_18425 [Paraburkholderia hospita]EIM99830.1 hypothetical protein WQE_17164 [Paraburkholderia hospita]OUL85742.1 hypothetical protein CA602_17155 [Paraburkholderia hospita]OUL88576.1 hypothetical protein CA601_18795 [Paraburkholderia hospita]